MMMLATMMMVMMMCRYVLFAINRRQEIKQSHPHLPFTEVTKVLGQEWSSMPLDKKQVTL